MTHDELTRHAMFASADTPVQPIEPPAEDPEDLPDTFFIDPDRTQLPHDVILPGSFPIDPDPDDTRTGTLPGSFPIDPDPDDTQPGSKKG